MLRPITSFNKDPYKFLRFMLPESCHISYLFDSVIDVLSDYIMKFVKNKSLIDKYLFQRVYVGYGFDDKGHSKKESVKSDLLPTDRPLLFYIVKDDKKWVMGVNKNKG